MQPAPNNHLEVSQVSGTRHNKKCDSLDGNSPVSNAEFGLINSLLRVGQPYKKQRVQLGAAEVDSPFAGSNRVTEQESK